ncbi:MAG: hypothetical protein JW779_10345 [Candidatus Thorarchaeota archaeon]|nr:hypothetical protein [Candidatus Thorarchaeota archaeon]
MFLKDTETNVDSSERDVQQVPFVELYKNRIQGVVSSGSDVNRVYIAYIDSDTHNYYCSTNNNRRCGGLRGSYCKHIRWMLDEAIQQYGVLRIAEFLHLDSTLSGVQTHHLHGREVNENLSEVFSRFLGYLKYLDGTASSVPIPELSWFI